MRNISKTATVRLVPDGDGGVMSKQVGVPPTIVYARFADANRRGGSVIPGGVYDRENVHEVTDLQIARAGWRVDDSRERRLTW